jgi:hypothetical protein
MRVLLVIAGLIAASLSGLCAADESDDLLFRPGYAYDGFSLRSDLSLGSDTSLRPAHADYALGVRRFRLEDGAARLVGWQLAEHWYFGKRRGDDDGFGLVWQGETTQIAITDEGINWRHRFSLLN